MEVYVIVPVETSATRKVIELCRRLFSTQKEKVEIHSSVDELCAKVAKELASCIGAEVDTHKGQPPVKESVQIFVLTPYLACVVAKLFDPTFASKPLTLDALVPIKDTRKIFRRIE